MVQKLPNKIPVFPLRGAVFFPQTNLPLNIFEDRYLKMVENAIKGNGVITTIERVSKPGRRVYVNQNQLPRVLDGLGISILSTSKGVLSNKVAKRFGVGGEVICNVW